MSAGDLTAVEELCRLQLAARRLGCRILVHDASESLRDLIMLVGLADVLLADEPPSGRPSAEPGNPQGDVEPAVAQAGSRITGAGPDPGHAVEREPRRATEHE